MGAGRPEWPSGPACPVPDTQIRKQRPTGAANPSGEVGGHKTTAIRTGGPPVQTRYLDLNKPGEPRNAEKGWQKTQGGHVWGPGHAPGRTFRTCSLQSGPLSPRLTVVTTREVRAVLLFCKGTETRVKPRTVTRLVSGRVQWPLLEKPVYQAPQRGGAEYKGRERKEEPCPQLNRILVSTPPLSDFVGDRK